RRSTSGYGGTPDLRAVGIQLDNLGSDGLLGWPCGQFTKELAVGEHREDDIAPPPGQAHHRRIVPLAFGPFLLVVGLGCGVAVRRDPRGSEQGVLQSLVT